MLQSFVLLAFEPNLSVTAHTSGNLPETSPAGTPHSYNRSTWLCTTTADSVKMCLFSQRKKIERKKKTMQSPERSSSSKKDNKIKKKRKYSNPRNARPPSFKGGWLGKYKKNSSFLLSKRADHLYRTMFVTTLSSSTTDRLVKILWCRNILYVVNRVHESSTRLPLVRMQKLLVVCVACLGCNVRRVTWVNMQVIRLGCEWFISFIHHSFKHMMENLDQSKGGVTA